MMPHRPRLRAVAAAALAGLVLPALAVSASSAADRSPTPSKRAPDISTKVAAPKIKWQKCGGSRFQCAEIKVPLDYRKPSGEKVLLTVGRLKAADPKKRVGSIFVNPGGPGGPSVDMALDAERFLPPELTDRFDIIGIDPRGTGFSSKVRCFTSPFQQQNQAAASFELYFPVTKAEIRRYQKAAGAVGRGCSTTGKPRTASMSTAQVARDMDLLRRSVGDKSLNFIGFSYGSYLGQVYANLFPSKVRTMVIDGVIDPVKWAGTKSTANTPMERRLRSSQGAWKAQREIFRRCKSVGPKNCTFAKGGDPAKKFAKLAQRLKVEPLKVDSGDDDWVEWITYQDLVSEALGALYSEDGYTAVDYYQYLYEQVFGSAKSNGSSVSESNPEVRKRLKARRGKDDGGFPYNSSLDHFSTVLCTDGLNPKKPAAWVTAARELDKVDRYFGALWSWSNAQCAGQDWTVKDPTRYAGPFTARTANPVLVMGNYWDPATNYSGAVAAARLLPNSRLLKSDNWGHTAYGTSECTVDAVANYVLRKKLPPKGTVCEGAQPFEADTMTLKEKPSVERPPVVPFVPTR